MLKNLLVIFIFFCFGIIIKSHITNPSLAYADGAIVKKECSSAPGGPDGISIGANYAEYHCISSTQYQYKHKSCASVFGITVCNPLTFISTSSDTLTCPDGSTCRDATIEECLAAPSGIVCEGATQTPQNTQPNPPPSPSTYCLNSAYNYHVASDGYIKLYSGGHEVSTGWEATSCSLTNGCYVCPGGTSPLPQNGDLPPISSLPTDTPTNLCPTDYGSFSCLSSCTGVWKPTTINNYSCYGGGVCCYNPNETTITPIDTQTPPNPGTSGPSNGGGGGGNYAPTSIIYPLPTNGFCADQNRNNSHIMVSTNCTIDDTTYQNEDPGCNQQFGDTQDYYYQCNDHSKPSPTLGQAETQACEFHNGVAPNGYIGGQCDKQGFDAAKASSGVFCKASYTDAYKCNDGTTDNFATPNGSTICSQAPWCSESSSTTPSTTLSPTISSSPTPDALAGYAGKKCSTGNECSNPFACYPAAGANLGDTSNQYCAPIGQRWCVSTGSSIDPGGTCSGGTAPAVSTTPTQSPTTGLGYQADCPNVHTENSQIHNVCGANNTCPSGYDPNNVSGPGGTTGNQACNYFEGNSTGWICCMQQTSSSAPVITSPPTPTPVVKPTTPPTAGVTPISGCGNSNNYVPTACPNGSWHYIQAPSEAPTQHAARCSDQYPYQFSCY